MSSTAACSVSRLAVPLPMAMCSTPCFRTSWDSRVMASLPLPRTVGGVDHRGVQHLSGAVHHRHLTAHAVAGVQSHGHPALHRGLHQQGLQI